MNFVIIGKQNKCVYVYQIFERNRENVEKRKTKGPFGSSKHLFSLFRFLFYFPEKVFGPKLKFFI